MVGLRIMGNVCDDLSQSFSWSSQKRSQSNPIGTLFTRSICIAQHSRQAGSSTITLVFRSMFMDLYELSKASVAGIWPILPLKGKVLAPGGRDLGRFRDFLYSGRGW